MELCNAANILQFANDMLRNATLTVLKKRCRLPCLCVTAYGHKTKGSVLVNAAFYGIYNSLQAGVVFITKRVTSVLLF